MKLVAGSNLSQYQKNQVLAAFPYKHLAIGPGKAYETLNHWVVEHAFWFRNDDQLAGRRHAEPAWMVKYANK